MPLRQGGRHSSERAAYAHSRAAASLSRGQFLLDLRHPSDRRLRQEAMIARSRIVPVACVLLALGCAVGLMRVVSSLGLQIPLDPNEGWNAYHAQAAITG